MFNPIQLKRILISQKALSKQEFERYIKNAEEENVDLADFLIAKKIITEDRLYQIAADYYKVPFIDLSEEKVKKDAMLLIPESIAQTHKIIAFERFIRPLRGRRIFFHYTPGSATPLAKLGTPLHPGLFKLIPFGDKRPVLSLFCCKFIQIYTCASFG